MQGIEHTVWHIKHLMNSGGVVVEGAEIAV